MADLTKLKAVRDGSVTFTVASAAASQTIVGNDEDEKVFLYVKNTDAVTARINVNAGNGVQSVLGALKIDVATTVETLIGPLTSARFKDLTTGKITVAVTGTNDSAFGGTITAVKLAVVVLP